MQRMRIRCVAVRSWLTGQEPTPWDYLYQGRCLCGWKSARFKWGNAMAWAENHLKYDCNGE